MFNFFFLILILLKGIKKKEIFTTWDIAGKSTRNNRGSAEEFHGAITIDYGRLTR